ncbi:MAG: APH(3') family aminoglycoside O-phosphotransferase, partial [Alphaproteobacteria bacterium]
MTGTLAKDPRSEIPTAWQDDLAGYAWHRQTIGVSGALVHRLQAVGRRTLFVKSERAEPFAELPDEALRLQWLNAQDMAVAGPAFIDLARAGGRVWLLMGAVPGRNLASTIGLAPQGIVEIAADALRKLHRIDVATCPFDHRLEKRIVLAQARMMAGLVDEMDFDGERLGRTAADLFDELVARRPAGEDLVVTHGDACLPNLLAEDGRFAGFVDCARLGVADRHQDLALAGWSVGYNLGQEWVEPFLHCDGLPAEPDRLDYYRL